MLNPTRGKFFKIGFLEIPACFLKMVVFFPPLSSGREGSDEEDRKRFRAEIRANNKVGMI